MLKKFTIFLIAGIASAASLLFGEALAQMSPLASANGKYANLRQILTCPQHRAQYGQFHEYGFWGGGSWCGQNGKAGFLVWVMPNWYNPIN